MFHNRAVVEWVKLFLFDEYPDVSVPEYLIESIFLGVLDFIKAGLEAEEDITIPSLGKFHTKKKESRFGKEQYYVKFKASRHLVLNLRQVKGTLTEAEHRDIAKKREFVQNMWEKKQVRVAAAEAKKKEREDGTRNMSPTLNEIRQLRKNRAPVWLTEKVYGEDTGSSSKSTETVE